MDAKKINALAFLGWHFVTHFFKKALRHTGPGDKLFLNSYATDGIFAIDKGTRARMPSFSHCLSCRLCDVVCPEILAKPGLLPPSYMVASFSRSLTDYALFRKESFDCGTCRECETICPERVPIREIVDFMYDASSNR